MAQTSIIPAPLNGQVGSAAGADAPAATLDAIVASWALKSAVRWHMLGGSDVPAPDVLAEGRALLRAADPTPVTPDAICAWLEAIASGLNDAPEPEAILGRAAVLFLAIQDTIVRSESEHSIGMIDGRAFGEDAKILALRHFRRWPTVADLFEFCLSYQRRLDDWIVGLESLIDCYDRDEIAPTQEF